MKVSLIGTSGLVGTHLLKEMKGRGWQTTAFSSQGGNGIDPETGLLPSNFSVEPGTAAVVYLAQSPFYREGKKRWDHLMAVNVMSSVQAAQAAIRVGVKQLLYFSTGSIYQPAQSPLTESSPWVEGVPYALSKQLAEKTLEVLSGESAGELKIGFIRLFGAYGPGQRGKLIPDLALSITEGRPIKLDRAPGEETEPPTGVRLNPIFIDDLTAITLQLIEKGLSGPLNVAGPELFSVKEVALKIGERLNRPVHFEESPQIRKGDLLGDIGKLESLLSPRFTSFPAGLARTLPEPCA